MIRRSLLVLIVVVVAGCNAGKSSEAKERIVYPMGPVDPPDQERLAVEVSAKPLLPTERMGRYRHRGHQRDRIIPMVPIVREYGLLIRSR